MPDEVEPVVLGAEAVDPAFTPAVAPVEPVVEPAVVPVAEPVAPVEGVPVIAPVVLPEAPVEPVDPIEAEPPATLALTSMKFAAAGLAVPAVPVAPVVAVPVVAIVLPAPDTRHPVTTTFCPCVRLPAVVPVCGVVPDVDCAAAPTPSATAIIVPKRNCRFM